MRKVDKIFTVAVGVLCLICSSCTKEGADLYSGSYWNGEWELDVEIGDTGEIEHRIQTINLTFPFGFNECIVKTGTSGLCLVYSINYQLRWRRSNRFELYDSDDTDPQPCFTGTITGDTMKLECHKELPYCALLAGTYELSRNWTASYTGF